MYQDDNKRKPEHTFFSNLAFAPHAKAAEGMSVAQISERSCSDTST
jgi:hypothetical protein